jgi:hypothetical protein
MGDGMSRSSDGSAQAWRRDRRERLLLARQQAALRRRRSGVAVRPPETLPLTNGNRIVGKLQQRPLAH